jgi:hypothetical protein
MGIQIREQSNNGHKAEIHQETKLSFLNIFSSSYLKIKKAEFKCL